MYIWMCNYKSMENKIIKKMALVMALSDPYADPRVNRVIKLLHQIDFTVDVLSYKSSHQLPINNHFIVYRPMSMSSKISNKINRVIIKLLSKIVYSNSFLDYMQMSLIRYENKLAEIITKHYDYVIVENLQMLPTAFSLTRDSKIIFDAREYYPRQNEESLMFRLFEKNERIRLCSKYLNRCNAVITVSPGLAEEYSNQFNIDPCVIRSVPYYEHLSPIPINSSSIKMVHHGVALKNRKIENMIDVARNLGDGYTLDFYLGGSRKYIEHLKKYSYNCSRIRFLDPVPFHEIIKTLNNYDIGLYYLEPTGFNVTYNLPNKFFEFIQARLAVAIGPSPDMKQIVEQYECGFSCGEFKVSSMVNEIKSISTQKIMGYKNNSDIAAKELCYESEINKYIDIFGMV
jgi:glycosyltransferase involved in cell wall biosynthesis